MSATELTKEEKLDEAARMLAEFMYGLTIDFKGLEREIAMMMTAQLGGYVAVVSKKPKEAIEACAKNLLKTDYNAIRAAHFGYQTLGVDSPREVDRPSGTLVQMGDPRQRRKDSDGS